MTAVRVAVANMKGGVGKSTSVLMLAEGLAFFGAKSVLAVDLDPQANLTFMMLGGDGLRDVEASERSLTTALADFTNGRTVHRPNHYVHTKATDVAEMFKSKVKGRVDMLATTPRLRFSELEFERQFYRRTAGQGEPARELGKFLDDFVAQLDLQYDYIIFDCPPGFTSLSRAAISGADVILSPTIADEVSTHALADFVKLGMRDDLNLSEDTKHGVIICKYQRLNLDMRRVAEFLEENYSVLAPRIKEHQDVTRATYRLRRDSFRPFNAKWPLSLRADLRQLVMSFESLLS